MKDGLLCRRSLLVLGAGALAGPVLSSLGCSPAGGQPPVGKIAAGSLSALAAGALRVVQPWSLALGRDSAGVWAMSLVCTHAGCDMSDGVGASSIFCNCHGSEFNLTGNVLAGPARYPLQHYAVLIDTGGAITVDADQPVAASVRTAV